MRLVKYCKSEHNIAAGCKTLHLGTFDYYREADPTWSIADTSEGFILYRGPATQITVGASALNAISGGAIHITDGTTASDQPPVRTPGAVHFKDANSNYVFTPEGLRATIGPDLEVRLCYPNSYIFCVACLSDGEAPNPSSVSSEYDSVYYLSKSADITTFISCVAKSLCEQLTVGDLNLDGFGNIPYNQLSLPVEAVVLHNMVTYVADKTIHLNTEQDFTQNRCMDIYFDTMFRKPASYSANAEYRFVFLLKHPILGILPIKKSPKVLQLMPIAETICIS